MPYQLDTFHRAPRNLGTAEPVTAYDRHTNGSGGGGVSRRPAQLETHRAQRLGLQVLLDLAAWVAGTGAPVTSVTPVTSEVA